MAKESEQQTFEASPGRVYNAVVRVVAELGYTVLHNDREGFTVSFNTGRSMWSWAGQDLTATALAHGNGRTTLMIGGSLGKGGNPFGGGSQVGAWGEKGRLTHKVFERVAAVLPHTPEPEPAPSSGGGSSVADEITKLADLNNQGVLSDEEFAAAKARLLG